MNKREAIAALAKIIGAVSNLPDHDKEIKINIDAFFHHVSSESVTALKPLINKPSSRQPASCDNWILSDADPSHKYLTIALFGPKEVICP